jgi:vancomycin resistance protein VanJ
MSEPRAPRFYRTLPGWSLAYAALLVPGLLALEWLAEYWLPLWGVLFAPPVILLMPLGLLTPLALLRRRWRALAIQAACVLAVYGGFVRYRWGASAAPAEHAFTVITHNIGQGDRLAFDEFFPQAAPDAIILQDAAGRSDYSARYPSLRMKAVDQFVLLTPHLIDAAAPVPEATWRGRTVAVRFVVREGDKQIALYSVHLPTPRRTLKGFFSARVAMEMVGAGSAPTDDYPSYRTWLDARLSLATRLAEVFRKEPLPYLVGGDFNTPDHGVVYHTFASELTDAHVAVGGGAGFTFPGTRDGRAAALFGPWLRLDYWFAGKGWKPLECRVASDARSQHRAVLARFVPAPCILSSKPSPSTPCASWWSSS